MTEREYESPFIRQSFELLESVRGKTLTLEQREKAAIELAAKMLSEGNRTITYTEKKVQAELKRMMNDPKGKAFTMVMTDQCFRSHRSPRIANQLIYLLNQYGVPRYLDWIKRLELAGFQMLGQAFSYIMVPLATFFLRKATSKVILPGEASALKKHMQLRRQQGVRLNLNHLGEAILGEEEAKHRLNVYLKDLEQEDIEYISVKISTIYSQIHLIGWEKTLEILSDRLRQLYRAAMKHTFTRADGSKVQKFVNLDMEEYRDLILTKDLFKKVLEEPEFLGFSAGIVLQAYLPDAHAIQKELTEWSMQRMSKGGAAIKIRIVKGANLSMEQFEASLRDWGQAPYTKKSDVDANYKRMVTYGCLPPHAKAVHLGIGSHNLFDIAYAMLMRAENGVEKEITFEMLEGMADHIRRVVQRLTKEILLYCPVATKEDFQSAIAYLIRRLDENTGPQNFLKATFGLQAGSSEWDEQVLLFNNACREMNTVYMQPRRTQNRLQKPHALDMNAPFENEADTDFALPHNREWAKTFVKTWEGMKTPNIPLVIAAKEIHQDEPEGEGFDPAEPSVRCYRYSLADWKQVDAAIECAKGYEATWSRKSVEERCKLLSICAQKMREKRGDLIGVMMLDGGKTILEGDPEVSEAIDFAEYYLRSMKKMDACKDITWKAKGTVLVTPPWNFPVSIPAGGILAALVAGNCVLFKPAPEAVLSGWVLVNTLWDAGIPKEALQFINCADDPVGSKLIADPRINMIVLTGGTSTARLFMRLRPGLDLAAETGGKNAMIITDMADRDLAIKDMVHSAFGHNGQKCSACSLAILEAAVYDDAHFRKQLKDAVESLKVGSCWEMANKVTPLIRAPSKELLVGLTRLDPGEQWLVTPKQDPQNPNLWSPGVKLGVQEGSFSHTTEFFGPVLSIMRAKNLEHAIELANGSPYGLTSGLQSLDEREQKIWMEKIEAGNCYINRTITGAIVRRQPFGGTKASSFGNGAKAGGPNYLAQFMIPTQVALPQDKHPINDEVNSLTSILKKIVLTPEELGIWFDSVANYALWAKKFEHDHDPSRIVGQDNLLRYRPHKHLCFRIQESDAPIDILRVLAAGMSCKSHFEVSFTKGHTHASIASQIRHLHHYFKCVEETEDQFNQRVKQGVFRRIRLLSPPSMALKAAASESAAFLNYAPVLANGRFELLHYLREIAFSIDYHRYGNLGLRESEERKPIL
ncbi:MAG: bifunctional proline dehydrogenase/L-glutamate gamma-semialdehyde dehydrogenase [Rhabdochlamydiaceae bacterium]|nr:bifunctional proline dehydrogenase/L-glutamate gamma-semialdehyde dehydrogenase [Rhabdochlamydiaceae bacterium]